MVERRVRRKPLRVNNRAILQDARQAMGNDLMNALVELITNADDSYTRLDSRGVSEIRIEVDRSRRVIWVDDAAEGMTMEQLEERLGGLGERTSGIAENDQVRGFFGRGAKDVAALGDVTWITVRDGFQSQLTIGLMSGDDDAVEIADPIADEPDKHGTTVQLQLRDGVRIPHSENLAKLLSRHFALIPILTDPARRLVLVERGSQKRIVHEMREGVQRLDLVRFKLPTYPGESIEVTLYEAPESLDEAETGRLNQPQYWRHSLLVTSGRAAYEFWPGSEYSKPPESAYFRRLFGRVNVPMINRLLIESDILSGGEEVVSRNRHGLARGGEHRFSAALDEALTEALRPHIERMRQEALRSNADQTTPKTQRMLNDLASELNDYVREETEAEPGGSGTESGDKLAGLRVIPSTRHVEPMRPARLLVRYQPSSPPIQPPIATVTISDDSNTPIDEAITLKDRGGYFSSSYRLEGREAESFIELLVRIEREEAPALVLWQDRIYPEIDAMRFERTRYTMKPGSTRNVRLLAPVEYHDLCPRVEFVDQTALEMAHVDTAFRWDDERECCVYTVRVSGELDGLSADVRGEVEGVEKFTKVRTKLPGLSGMKIELSEQYEDAPERVWYDAETNLLTVNAKHRDASGFLGPYEEGRPGQESLPFRTMLRELVCHAVVSHTLQESQSELRDPGQILGAYEREYERLIERTRGILVGDV